MKKSLYLLTVAVLIAAIVVTIGFSGCKATTAEETAAKTVTEETAAETVTEETAAETVAEEKPLSGTIVIWKGPSAEDERGTVFNEVFDAFEKENPEVKIEFLNTPWSEIQEKYTAAFASGNPPDLIYSFTGGYVDAVISQCMDYNEVFTKEELAFMAKSIPENVMKEFIINKKLMGIPFLTAGTGLVYNIKMLADAGYAEPPQTWEEMLEMCKKLTKDLNNDGKTDVWGLGELGGTYPCTEFFINQAGATLFNDDLTGLGYDNEMGKAAYEFMDKLWNIEKVAVPSGLYASPMIRDAFFEGKFAMYRDYGEIRIIQQQNHPDFKMWVAPMPAGPGKNLCEGRGTYAGSGAWSIAKDTKNLEAVKKLLMYLYNPKYLPHILQGLGMVSSRAEIDIEIDPFIKEMATGFLKYGVAYPFSPYINEVREAVHKAGQSLQSGSINAEEAFNQAVKFGKIAFK